MIVLLSVVFSEFTKLQLRPTFQCHHSNRLRVSCRTACFVAFAVMDGKSAVAGPGVDARRATPDAMVQAARRCVSGDRGAIQRSRERRHIRPVRDLTDSARTMGRSDMSASSLTFASATLG